MELKVCDLLDGLQTSPLVREVERFKYVRERSVVAAYSLYRSLQVEEARLLDGSCQLGTEAPGVGSLVTDNAAASLDGGLEDCFSVPGQDAHQINHLAAHTKFLLSQICHLLENMDLGAPTYQGHVGPFL